MNFVPKPHQPAMLEWMAERDVSALFASPGLGKTAVVLKELDRQFTHGESRGALIIAPKRVCTITWPDQIEKWAHSKWMRYADLRTPEGREAWDNAAADIYLINSEQLPSIDVTRKGKTTHRVGFVEQCIQGRKTLPVDTLVIDELSLAKNWGSKRFNSIRSFTDKFPKRIGLTGTPVPNTYMDLFAQIRMLDKGERLGRGIGKYRQAYFKSDYMGFKYEILPGAKEKIDAKLADLALVMQGSEYLDIPTVSAIDVNVVLPAKARRDYLELEKELLLELEEGDVVALNAATLTMKLVQMTGGAVYSGDEDEKVVHHLHDSKIKAMHKVLKKHRGEPVLILTSFKHEMERVLAALPGARKFHERDMRDWQDGTIPYWVADARSLSHGIDGLQDSCRVALWFSLTYSNETYIQTNARLARTGQEHETLIYRLIAEDTIDDAVAEALRTKSDNQAGLMNALSGLQRMRSRGTT